MQCTKCNKKVYANEVCVCGEKAPKKNNGAVRFNTIVCFILVFISALSLITTLSLRTIVNDNLIVEVIEDVKLEELEIDGKKLDQVIFDEYINDDRVSIENVDNLLQDPFIKDFLIEKVEAYQDFALDKGDAPVVTADEIVNLITENEDKIYNEVGLRFLEPDKEELRESLGSLDEFEEFTNDFLNTGFGSRLVQTYFSYANVIFHIVLMVVIFIQWFVVYKANSRRAAKMMSKYSIALIIPSALILIAILLVKIIPDLNIADELLSSVLKTFMIYSAILIIVGLVPEMFAVIADKSYKSSKTVTEIKTKETTVIPEPIAENNKADNEPQVSSENVCPQCSHNNKENSAFCSRCGTKLK